jgi:hypothetical protein
MATYKSQVNNISKDAIQALSNIDGECNIKLNLALEALNKIAMLTNSKRIKQKCNHDYSDGTGTGWYVCKKCGDLL